MNTYLYYSEINRKVISIQAEDYNHSLEILRRVTRKDVKNDYILVNSDTYTTPVSIFEIPSEL